MKIAFNLAAFVEAGRALSRIPPSSAKLDILDHARLDAAGGKLTITMSDLDMEGAATVACEGDDGMAAIPRAVLEFFAVRSGAAPETATLEFDDGMKNVVGRHGAARITMPIMLGSDFPLLSAVKPSWSIKLRAHVLCRALKRTEKAVATNETQLSLLGAFLHQVGDALLMIGADGGRLHLVDLDAATLTGELPRPTNAPAPGVMIPTRAIREIQSMFSDDESEVEVSGTDGMLTVAGSQLRITSKLIDAVYLDYIGRILGPFSRPDAYVSVSTEHLLRALDGLTKVPKTEAKGKRVAARVVATIEASEIVLTTAGDAGDAEDRIAIENHGVAPRTVLAFHPLFLRDALAAADAKTVTIHPSDQVGMPFHIANPNDAAATIMVGQRRL